MLEAALDRLNQENKILAGILFKQKKISSANKSRFWGRGGGIKRKQNEKRPYRNERYCLNKEKALVYIQKVFNYFVAV